MASLRPTLDFLPVTKVKCQLLAFYLFVFSCYFYQSFRFVASLVIPWIRGFWFRAAGYLNSDFARVSQNRNTDFSGVRKNLCLLSDSCEIRVKMRFFKQLYRCPIGLQNDYRIMSCRIRWPLETPPELYCSLYRQLFDLTSSLRMQPRLNCLPIVRTVWADFISGFERIVIIISVFNNSDLWKMYGLHIDSEA